MVHALGRSFCVRLLVFAVLGLAACAQSSEPPGADGGTSGCTYAGTHYAVGESFTSSDGCNQCSCGAGGQVACTARACADGGAPTTLHWYKTCGAPVCGPQFDGPTGKPLCTTEHSGDSCNAKGAECDPSLGCAVSLICAASDPTRNPGGCPISRARFKDDIRYLDAQERAQVAEQLLATPLARWRYKHDPARSDHVGFIIEDVEPSPSVDGDKVNLYGYTSMAVAALQVQAEQIRALQAELREQQRQLARLQRPRTPRHDTKGN